MSECKRYKAREGGRGGRRREGEVDVAEKREAGGEQEEAEGGPW